MASDPARKSSSSSSGGQQKHRACDECRSRKLACSKEPDGCSRCRREGIRCVYSAQKPMGRPRKRRNVDDDGQDEPQSTSPPLRQQRQVRGLPRQRTQSHSHVLPGADPALIPNDSTLLTAQPHASEFNDYDAVTMLPLDPTLAFLDDQRQGNVNNFLDILPVNYATHATSHNAQHTIASAEPNNHGDPSSLGLDLQDVDLLGGIGFQQPTPRNSVPQSAATRVMHDSFSRYMAKTWDDGNNNTAAPTSISSTTNTTPSTTSENNRSTTLRPNPNISCGCLSSLYLTLDCLGNLPADIPAAIRTVRNASRVAHSTIRCDFCSGTRLVYDTTIPIPIQAFQNLMLLAALVPSACNAYALILERVDEEADRARLNNEELWFSFKDIGGHWGMEAEDGKACLVMQSFNEKMMPPDLWRTTIREIIRMDVDGVAGEDSPDGQGTKGLRDVIKSLEDRSHKRHAHMDAAAAMGQMPKHSVIIPPTNAPVAPHDRHCMRVLDAARMALDNLVIA